MQRTTVMALAGAGIVGAGLAIAVGVAALPGTGTPASVEEPATTKVAPVATTSPGERPVIRPEVPPTPAQAPIPAVERPRRTASPTSPELDAVMPDVEAFLQQPLELGEVLDGVPPEEAYRTYVDHVESLNTEAQALAERLEAVAEHAEGPVAARALDQAGSLYAHMAQHVRSSPPPSMLSPKETRGWENRNLDLAERHEDRAAAYAERSTQRMAE